MKEYKLFLSCVLWSAFILFFVSPDSYTHDLFYRWDSAWFFTCGKAWAEGLLPYVDFADSKGPVLWLIHALAYIISPYNYLGLFWLSVFLFGVVFYIDYKIAYLFLNNKQLSIIVVLFLPIVYFNPWYHTEISAEDWCQPIISLVIYRVTKMIVLKEYTLKELSITGFFLGFGLVWTLLIKFSITIMLGVTECYCLYYIVREKVNIVKPLLSFFLGLLVLSLPLGFYLYYIGVFNAFFDEYFINTMQTVSSANVIGDYVHEWFRTFADAYYMILFAVCVIGGYMLGARIGKDRYFFVVAFLGFYGLAIRHNIHRHYVSCCSFFALPFVVYLITVCKDILLLKYQKMKRISFGFVSVFVILANWTYTEGYIVPNLFFVNQEERRNFYTVAYYMSQIERPTLLYYRYSERGYGTPVGALPASRYWSTQVGATQRMLDIQHKDAISGRADFIISYATKENESLFSNIGYYRLYEFGSLSLYGKDELIPPPDSFYISSIDVLLKRNVLERYSRSQCNISR